MSRFRRLSQSEVSSLYRHAQMETSGDALKCPNPSCPSNAPALPDQPPPPTFTMSDVEKKGAYGRYMYTCPICGWKDISRRFSKPTLDGQGIGKGTRLDNNETAQKVTLTPNLGITTIT